VVSTPGNDHWQPSWSPDGRELVYSADGPDNEGEIATVSLTTGRITMLTDNTDHEGTPDWRP
jgi:Tol biopolymer transport system component